jgi:hypothetical protein
MWSMPYFHCDVNVTSGETCCPEGRRGQEGVGKGGGRRENRERHIFREYKIPGIDNQAPGGVRVRLGEAFDLSDYQSPNRGGLHCKSVMREQLIELNGAIEVPAVVGPSRLGG